MTSAPASILWQGARTLALALGAELAHLRRLAVRRQRLLVAAALAVATLLSAVEAVPAADPPSPDSQAQVAALMAQLAQRKHGRVAYVEEHFIGALERPLKSSGELLYDAPGRLEKRTLLPKPETVVLQDGTMKVQRGRHTYEASLQDYPQLAPLIETIRAILAGDRPALERLFTLGWQGSSEQWHLRLTPHNADMSQTVKEIDIHGSGARIQSVEILQPDGDRSLLTIGAEIPE
jgi:hypothetical protein